jgi:hypothetical protein
MNTIRSCAVIALVGCLALSATEVSFGQAPASADPPVQVPEPTPAVPVPAAPAQPLPAAGAQPVPAAPVQPLPAAPVQPLPVAPGPSAAAQPLPAAPVQPVPAAGEQAIPVAGVPSLSLIRGSHIIGSRAILAGGVAIGTVQDLLFVAGSGEYVLVANPTGFVTIPRSLTIFEPVPRILQVNMTFAQVVEVPRLLQLAQLNRPFLERVHTFFRSPRGEAILRNNLVRNASPAHAPSVAERRAETHTANKRAIHPQTRSEHPENGTNARR